MKLREDELCDSMCRQMKRETSKCHCLSVVIKGDYSALVASIVHRWGQRWFIGHFVILSDTEVLGHRSEVQFT